MSDRLDEAGSDETRAAPGNDGPGAQIAHYKILEQIGEGGFGTVFVAEQSQPVRRRVALKIIKLGMDSKQVVARFEAERQALALMDHPHIARVFDGGATASGRPYFVMELVKGAPITTYCNTLRLPLRDRLALFDQVCAAVQHAHAKGVIHRDLKPTNVLVSTHDDKPFAKVIDFGIAKATSGRLSEQTVYTESQQLLGTPEYMSPEQAEGSLDIDTRTDVYALGVLLYELVTGVTPFDPVALRAAGYAEIQRVLRHVEPPKPSTRVSQLAATRTDGAKHQRGASRALVATLRGELDWIVMKAIDKDRARRYETASALSADVRRYLSGEPVQAAPPSTTYRLFKHVRQHRAWWTTAVAFAVLLIAAVIVSSWMAVRARRAEQLARAVTLFLQDDVLAQAGATAQAGPGSQPDPDLRVRTALDRAAERIEGKFDPLVEAEIRSTIGDTYVDLGLYEEAQGQLERGLALRRRILGEDHADTLNLMDQTGLVYAYQDQHDQAQPLLSDALDIARRALGDENVTTLSIMNNLALSYSRDFQFSQAEPLYVEVLAGQREVLGEEDPATLDTMTNLGMLYVRANKSAQAEPLLAQTVALRRRRQGEDHPSTISTMNNLALAHMALDQNSQAEPLMASVVAWARRVWGDEHPNTLASIKSLAIIHGHQGRYMDAEVLLRDKLAVARRLQGAKHRDTAVALSDLGWILLLQRQYNESEATLRTAVKIYEESPPVSWNDDRCRSLLGAALMNQRKYDEAEVLLISAHEGLTRRRESIPSWFPGELDQSADRIVQLYRDWGKPDKAAEWTSRLQRPRSG